MVVAVNKFSTDTQAELELVRNEALKFGAFDACIAQHWELGGEGATDLAHTVIQASHKAENHFRFSYKNEEPVKAKIERIAKEIYHAAEVEYSEKAEKRLQVE